MWQTSPGFPRLLPPPPPRPRHSKHLENPGNSKLVPANWYLSCLYQRKRTETTSMIHISSHAGTCICRYNWGDFTFTFSPLKNDEWKQLCLEKGFSSRRGYVSCVLSTLSHTAFSRACLGLALPGVQEKRRNKKKGWGGGRGQMQSLKDLTATLTSSRSKEFLLGLWSLDNHI